jgi:hypothetical protein
MFANFGGSAALPDYRVTNRFSGVPFPENRRFPLVGDADRNNLIRSHGSFDQHFPCRQPQAFPYLYRVVFHPSWPGKYLRKFFLFGRNNFSRAVENNRPGTGRPLIQREYVIFHYLTFPLFLTKRRLEL